MTVLLSKGMFFALLASTVILLPFGVLAADYSPATSAPTVPTSPTSFNARYSVAENTGAFIYEYPFTFPPGVRGMTPNVALTYNSQDARQQQGPWAAGWQILSPYIERDQNFTTTSLADDYYWLVDENGRNRLLYNSSAGQWHTRYDSFARIQNISSNSSPYGQYWLVTSPDGTQRRFGYGISRITHDGSGSHAVVWHLDLINDTYGNTISYSGTMTAHGANTPYLYSIQYANTTILSFSYEQRSLPRETARNSIYQKYWYRLANLTVTQNNSVIRSYHFNYSKKTGIELLSSIQEKDANGFALPATMFTYANAEGWTNQSSPWSLSPVYFFEFDDGKDAGARLIDITGDGLADYTRQVACNASYYNNTPEIDMGYAQLYPGTNKLAVTAQQYGISSNLTNYSISVAAPDDSTHNLSYVSYHSSSEAGVFVTPNRDLLVKKIHVYGSAGYGDTVSIRTASADILATTPLLGGGYGEFSEGFKLEAGTKYIFSSYDATGRVNKLGPSNNPVNTTYIYWECGYRGTTVPDCYNIMSVDFDVLYENSTTNGSAVVYIDNGTYDGTILAKTYIDKLFTVTVNGTTNKHVTDVISANDYCSPVLINTGNEFIIGNSDWRVPMNFTFVENGSDRGVRFGDIDGDSRVDIVRSDCTEDASFQGVLRNNGSGWEELAWNIPGGYCFSEQGYAAGAELIDVNGDGKADLINGNNAIYSLRTALNTGSGWSNTTLFSPPVASISSIGYDLGVRYFDFNGDALPDVLQQCWGCGTNAWINNGTDWKLAANWVTPTDYPFSQGGADKGLRTVDINGDGLVDILRRQNCTSSSCSGLLLNNGSGWVTTTSSEWIPNVAMAFTSGEKNKIIRLTDIDGDGAVDLVKRDTCSEQDCNITLRNLGGDNNFLQEIRHVAGGTTSITYNHSALLNNTGTDALPDMPFSIPVIATITTENNLPGTAARTETTTYNYTKGYYFADTVDSEFRGFGMTIAAMANATKRSGWYQNEGLRGQLQFVETYNASVLLQNKSYDVRSLGTSNRFIPLVYGVRIEQYDGESTSNNIQSNFTYDGYGNVLTQYSAGDSSVASDERLTSNTYEYNLTTWLVDLMSHEGLYGEDNASLLRETNYSRNSQGSVVSETRYLAGTGVTQRNYTYDTFGNIASTIDERGQQTSYTYDSLGVYQTTQQNPLNYTSNSVWNGSLGVLASQTDANGFETTHLYDTFGRKTGLVRPYDSIGAPTELNNYSFNGTAPESFTNTKKLNSTTNLVTYTHLDGIFKVVQIKQLAEVDQYATRDFGYDGNGRLNMTTNPYYTSTSAYSAPNLTAGYTSYMYDALDRITKIILPNGSTRSVVYNKNLTSYYDENGERKDVVKDAYGNVIRIIEYNGNETYTTSYTYDAADQLTQITDANGMQWNWTYDTLGRKTQLQDPDIGTWTYEYDAAGNLITQTDARGQVISLSYDALNRVTQKNGTTDWENYTYDVPIIGMISSIELPLADYSYGYDQRLRMTQQNVTIDGVSFSTSYEYDSQDNIAQKTLPNGSVITYTYNKFGKLESIPGVVTGIDYAASGLPSARSLANTLSTTYSYEPFTLRLNNIQTSSLQNLTYTYDGVGNILAIVDGNVSEAFTYDELHRLQTASRTEAGTTVYNQTFTLNPVNTILSILKNGVTTTFSYDGGPYHAPSSAE